MPCYGPAAFRMAARFLFSVQCTWHPDIHSLQPLNPKYPVLLMDTNRYTCLLSLWELEFQFVYLVWVPHRIFRPFCFGHACNSYCPSSCALKCVYAKLRSTKCSAERGSLILLCSHVHKIYRMHSTSYPLLHSLHCTLFLRFISVNHSSHKCFVFSCLGKRIHSLWPFTKWNCLLVVLWEQRHSRSPLHSLIWPYFNDVLIDYPKYILFRTRGNEWSKRHSCIPQA